ncbi:hypothetical protein, partial [Escherichia coli]|uniref:hypothetical protein n=2 Tax=Enterobacteriaceae TaxID=543 RepID=UPI00195315AB
MLEALLLFGPYFVIPFATLLAPAFIAVTFRWRMGGMRIGGASIASDFSISKAYGIYSLGLLGVFALATLAAFPVTLVLV